MTQTNQQAQRQFFISYLHTFPNNGHELLNALDDILNGDVRYLNPLDLWPLEASTTPPFHATLHNTHSPH